MKKALLLVVAMFLMGCGREEVKTSKPLDPNPTVLEETILTEEIITEDVIEEDIIAEVQLIGVFTYDEDTGEWIDVTDTALVR